MSAATLVHVEVSLSMGYEVLVRRTQGRGKAQSLALDPSGICSDRQPSYLYNLPVGLLPPASNPSRTREEWNARGSFGIGSTEALPEPPTLRNSRTTLEIAAYDFGPD